MTNKTKIPKIEVGKVRVPYLHTIIKVGGDLFQKREKLSCSVPHRGDFYPDTSRLKEFLEYLGAEIGRDMVSKGHKRYDITNANGGGRSIPFTKFELLAFRRALNLTLREGRI